MSKGTTAVSEERAFHDLLNSVLTGEITRRDMFKRAAALGLGASALSTLGLAANIVPGSGSLAYAQDATPEAVSGGTLRVGLQADPAGFDAQVSSATALWRVAEHIFDTLTRINPDLTVRPSLADTWDISADGLVYTFHLRPGVTFHDGSAMTANDVSFTFLRLLDPATASTSASDLSSIKGAMAFNAGASADATPVTDSTTLKDAVGIKVIDDVTLEITLEAPDASFLSTLANPSTAVYSQAFVEANNNDVTQVTNGTGAFKLDEYIPNTSLKMSRFDGYWDTPRPYLDGIEFTIAADDTARTGLVVQGSADFIQYTPLRDVDTLMANADLKVLGSSNTNIRFTGFNLTREPFNKLEVRQAIAKITDRAPMIESSVFGHGTAVSTIFPPDYWAALQVEPEAVDVEGAKALMATAGYADGFDTTITSWSEYSFLSNAAIVMQEQLKQIGINAELVMLDAGTMIDTVYVQKDFDIAVTGTSGYIDPHGLVLDNFGTGSGGNFVGYSNPEVDDLIVQGKTETDQEARAAIYQQIQTILLQDLPWVNLFVANQFETMKTNVYGYLHIPTGSDITLRESFISE
jgi:peptide/nickel transport system substrate-binding protein